MKWKLDSNKLQRLIRLTAGSRGVKESDIKHELMEAAGLSKQLLSAYLRGVILQLSADAAVRIAIYFGFEDIKKILKINEK